MSDRELTEEMLMAASEGVNPWLMRPCHMVEHRKFEMDMEDELTQAAVPMLEPCIESVRVLNQLSGPEQSAVVRKRPQLKGAWSMFGGER